MSSFYSIFFSKNISVCAIFDDENVNDTLTNDIISFEQLGPACWVKVLAEDILKYFFLFFPENRLQHFM